MNAQGQWFYLAGTETRGPVLEQDLIEWIRSGQLSPATQVALQGWPQWQTASALFGDRLAPPQPHLQPQLQQPYYAQSPQPQNTHSQPSIAPQQPQPSQPQQWNPQPAPSGPVPAAPLPTAIAAVQLRCVSGPDIGRIFVISASEVTLGRVAGLVDPAVAQHHVVLSWQANMMNFHTAEGTIIIDGFEPRSGALLLGQEFRMGHSVWQIGNQSFTLGGLLESVGSRLNSLASTEKLEGFSLGDMFSETFKKRTQDEIDDYFICGTARTTPAVEAITTGWPKPWFFMRVLLFFIAIYIAFSFAFVQFQNANLLPGLMMMGSLAVPLGTVILFFELNTPRNVPFHYTLVLICLGGIVSIAVSLFGFDLSGLANWLGAPAAGIVEEVGKILTVMIVVRNRRYRYILNGLLFGAAVGAGFAIFESAGYAFNRLLEDRAVSSMQFNILLRGILSPFGHVAWTAIAAGALWRVKGDKEFSPSMLANPLFWRAFLIPVSLHMIWNASIIPSPFWLKHLILGVIGWFVVFGLVQQGLRQVRDFQLAQAREELSKTKSAIAAVTGSHQLVGR